MKTFEQRMQDDSSWPGNFDLDYAVGLAKEADTEIAKLREMLERVDIRLSLFSQKHIVETRRLVRATLAAEKEARP